jgi:pyruvate formate-lyase activating enzyme-like uncharacterized protein
MDSIENILNDYKSGKITINECTNLIKDMVFLPDSLICRMIANEARPISQEKIQGAFWYRNKITKKLINNE